MQGEYKMTERYEDMPYDGLDLNAGAKMVSDHVKRRIYLIGCGKVADRRALFGEAVLATTSELEQRYVLDRTLAYLVAFGEIDLEVARVNDDGEPVYRRSDA